MSSVPVLEIGGSHVTGAVVDLVALTVRSRQRLAVEPGDPADTLLATFAAAGRAAVNGARGTAPATTWGVAIPGPFDYDAGIGRFEGVGKFDTLNDVDVGAALRAGLPGARTVRFLNDADAFAIGEWLVGAARAADRAVFLTLGSGVGSAFLADGRPVKTGPEVPPDGFVHTLTLNGRNVEDLFSRRALRSAYASRTGTDLDVHEITALARAGDATAGQVWSTAIRALVAVVGPWVRRFGARVVVVGGSIAGSWDLVEPFLAEGFAPARVRRAQHPEDAGLFGAAHWAVSPDATP